MSSVPITFVRLSDNLCYNLNMTKRPTTKTKQTPQPVSVVSNDTVTVLNRSEPGRRDNVVPTPTDGTAPLESLTILDTGEPADGQQAATGEIVTAPQPGDVFTPDQPGPYGLPPGNYKVLDNGAVYSLDRGRIAANPGGGTTAITSQNSGALARRSREVYWEAAQKGLASAHKRTSEDAWAYLTGRQSELAADTSRGRASTEAFRAVGQAIGAFSQQSDGASQPDARLELSDRGLERVLQALAGALSTADG